MCCLVSKVMCSEDVAECAFKLVISLCQGKVVSKTCVGTLSWVGH